MSEPAPEPRAVAWLALGAAAGLVCAALGLVDPGERRGGLPEGAAAVVNGVAIRVEEVERALRALESDRREPLGDGERRHVLERLVDEELLVQRGLELGLAQRDRRVRGDLVAAVIESVVAEADGAEPDAAEVAAFYDANAAYFAQSDRLWLEQVLVRGPPARSDDEARERAALAAERLRAGDPIEQVRAQLGDAPVAPLPADLLPLAKLVEYLGPSAARAGLALEPGGVSEPVRSAAGFQVLRLVERAAGATPPLAEVEEQVREELRRRAGDRALRAYLGELRERAELRLPDEPPGGGGEPG